ncbi:MAG: extracellular solute-binding protein, partial [Aliifodinibius sp.]|nr:extracellular solute-binding protein [Fodinibius sp.]
MKIKILTCLVLSCILISGISCGKEKKQSDDEITITFWHSFVTSTIPALKELLQLFESEHPDIKIKAQYIPTGDALIQKLITAVQSKTAPDISWLHSDYMQDLVEAKAIYKMKYFIEGEDGISPQDLEDIYPALRTYASWKDTLYSMPMEATNLALIYNKEMFRNAGLDPEKPPRTWDELFQYSQKMTIDENGDGKYEQIGFF